MPVEKALVVAAAAVGGMVVKDVLEDVADMLDQATENIAVRFSNVAQDILANLRASLDELYVQLRDDLSSLVNSLADSLQVQLYNLRLGAEKLISASADAVGKLTDEFVRDARQIVSRTWFMSEIYSLDEIEGTLVPASAVGDWTVRASGLNLGFDSEEIESVVKLVVDVPGGNPYTATGAEVSAHTVEFALPGSLTRKHRAEEETVTLNARLKIRIRKDRTLWFDKKWRGDQPFRITLAPRVAGEMSASAVVPTYGWVKRPELDIIYSNGLPSGHATSSSKVTHHRIARRFTIARASSPPRFGDRRFYAATTGACLGGGCGHLHEFRVSVHNNGSAIEAYTYNNSHAVTVRIHGKVERFEQTASPVRTLEPIDIRDGQVLEVALPFGFSTAEIVGRDADHGLVQLSVDRSKSPQSDVYPMPTGRFGGLEYLGVLPRDGQAIYRFVRR